MRSYNSLSRSRVGVTFARLVLVLGLTGMSAIAVAKPENVTAEEMALLPGYCPYTSGFGNSGAPSGPSPGAKPWIALMGDGFWALHHYCWGLINTQRALRSTTPPQTKTHLLGTVRQDHLYVVNNTRPNFILLPEIHTAIGDTELRLGLPMDANRSFAKARALKPDYWPAYSHWAEFLIRTGHTAAAKQVVKSGLEYSPNAKVLREQYRLLGGKASEIVPKIQEEPAANAAGETITPPVAEEPAPAAAATPAQ